MFFFSQLLFLILFISSHLNELFFLNPFYLSLHLKIKSPQTCPFLSLMYFVLQSGKIRVLYCRIMFKDGIGLLISWLMMRLAFSSNKELVCMLMHIINVGFEGLKLLRMDYIISC